MHRTLEGRVIDVLFLARGNMSLNDPWRTLHSDEGTCDGGKCSVEIGSCVIRRDLEPMNQLREATEGSQCFIIGQERCLNGERPRKGAFRGLGVNFVTA